MTRPNVQSWDPAAANNTDVGGIGLAENIMRPPAVNNALRELMAEVAKFYDDLGGVNTVAGTGDVITLTTASGFTALSTGLVLSFRGAAGNTTNVTINVDGLGAKAIRKVLGAEAALVAGDLATGGKYLLVYDAAANGAAGAWILLNAAGSAFSDAAFRVQDNGDATKQLALEVSGLTTGTTRTLTATDKSGTLILAADAAPGLGMVNGTLVATVASNALTIAIKTLAGNDPSVGDPVFVAFRNASAAMGDYAVRAITRRDLDRRPLDGDAWRCQQCRLPHLDRRVRRWRHLPAGCGQRALRHLDHAAPRRYHFVQHAHAGQFGPGDLHDRRRRRRQGDAAARLC
jgi:hypothetical protein